MSGLNDLPPEARAEMAARAKATKRRTTAARKAAGVPPRSEAVAAFCADCIYDPGCPGRWRAQVAACESRGCPLWPYRPGASLADLDGHDGVKLRDVLARKRADYREAV